MTTEDLKRNVRAAIASEWQAFEATHPKLAAVIDETMLVDAAVESLDDDPEYQETMADATAMGNAAQVMTDFVAGFVRRWLRQLV